MKNETSEDREWAPTAALYKSLAKAQAELKGVDKASRNDHAGYKYASAEDMMIAATEAMGNHGLSFVCVSAIVTAPKGKCDAMLACEYVLVHEGGGSIEMKSETPVHTIKAQPLDKAVFTARTYDIAYTLRSCLNIPRVDPSDERDAQADADIQAWQSEQQKERKKNEDKAKKEHAAKSKILRAKGKLVNENAPEFFKSAGVAWSQKAKGQFMMWAANVDGWPARDVDAQIEIVDHSLQYIAEWKQMDETEALSMANDFGVHVNGKSDHEARAEAAFDKAVEAGEA